MLITNIRTDEAEGVTTLRANVDWEESRRPQFDLRFEVPDQFASLVTSNADAFLVAALYPARRAGERRVCIDGAVCPYLVRGLNTAMHWHQHWYGPSCPVIAIEAEMRATRLPGHAAAGALHFFSGGVDSLHTLRRNRLEVPAGHRAAISHGLLVEGFDMRRGTTYARSLVAADAIAKDGGVTLIPVRTNVRDLDVDDEFWDLQFHGAALASVSHVFASTFDLAFLASGIEIEHLWPWGSHPLVDPLYSSCDLTIRHDSADVPRLEKVRVLAEWPVALDHLRVCYRNPQQALNCGTCEKCLRTMVELIAVGALDRASAFVRQDVSADELRPVRLLLDYHRVRWQETIPDLAARGRGDLVTAIEAMIARFHRWNAWKQERDWKGRIKRFDRKWTGGVIARLAAAR